MSPVRRFTTLVRPVTLGASLTAVVALTLTGCAGTSTTPTAPTSQGAQGGSGGGMGGGQRQPGVSGKIAAVSGKTLQVQAADAQTAVTYTAKTTFTEVSRTTADALATGLCVSVRSAETAASATDQVAASSVTVSAAVDGACTSGFGGGGFGGGTRPSGAPSGMPSGAPSGAPSGMPTNGARGGMGGTVGKVISIDGATLVVESTRPDESGTSTTTKVTVTTTDATTWEQVKAATAKSAVVGRCAVAMGTTDDTGALTATSLRLGAATADGSCSTGMRGGGQPPNGRASGAENGGTTGNG